MSAPPPPPIPKLPSRRVSAVLATTVLGVGIALGALIGPGGAGSIPSLASSSRAAALARVLALLAFGSGADSASQLALSSEALGPPASTPQPTPSSNSATSAGATTADGGASTASHTSTSSPRSSSSPSPSPRSTSPTAAAPAGGGEGEAEKKGKPLPPIANVWLIELPYGTSVENALKQSAAAPYLDGQLKREGTILSSYSSLATAQLAGAAPLLSGQVDASVTTLAPPPCGTGAAGGAGAAAGSGATADSGATAGSGSSAATAAGGTTNTPCPSGEPAGLQAADAFLQEVVPKIVASSLYKEHGLIAITFAAAGQQGAQTGAAATSADGTPTSASGASTPTTGASDEASAGIVYPTGSLTSTLTAAGTPAGGLLLSSFLSHAGVRVASAFNPLAPHESLEGLLKAKPRG
jgi:hypothetical protein